MCGVSGTSTISENVDVVKEFVYRELVELSVALVYAYLLGGDCSSRLLPACSSVLFNLLSLIGLVKLFLDEVSIP